MPLRSFLFPRAPRIVSIARSFHSSSVLRNHYETLGVVPGATPAEVKKSFYALSKKHHPDLHPDDPDANSRFVTISDAYGVLGTPAKRQEYDRSISLSSQPSPGSSTQRPQGSYHSSGPAGGRPASGLSRRRTQFHGPPPSFYRSGGWGAHSAKRKAAQDSHAESPAGTAGGMGAGQKPWGHDEVNDVPHFDREGHYRTQENHSRRWQRRKGMEGRQIDTGDLPRSMLANFFFVGGILSIGIMVPTLLFEKFSQRRGNLEK
ncbi:hypothetical protein WAI453_006157 [Rhynchosporium graminicola]|uniref:Related to MDJ1 Heat shock protein-chaperone n=1 Tax=Rhynchosporium graminicola TaxID=2792576 RepID=A0A1E1LDT4_9HELO|nr:related to MDJ1 Heat shock protein-chaperone [Rhynchosporium commune]